MKIENKIYHFRKLATNIPKMYTSFGTTIQPSQVTLSKEDINKKLEISDEYAVEWCAKNPEPCWEVFVQKEETVAEIAKVETSSSWYTWLKGMVWRVSK